MATLPPEHHSTYVPEPVRRPSITEMCDRYGDPADLDGTEDGWVTYALNARRRYLARRRRPTDR